MDYTMFAISSYILMRAAQVLFEDYLQKRWCKILLKILSLIAIYAALASLIVWYAKFEFLGFDPGK